MDRNADHPQLYRWDISSSEYFLIEYRHRDLNASGVELTIRQPDGGRVRQQFTNSDTDFIYQYAGFDTLLTAGTLLNVSNFDWSLPGGLDFGPDEKEGTEDDRELNGGLLIWHIDEGVIQRALTHKRKESIEESMKTHIIGGRSRRGRWSSRHWFGRWTIRQFT